MFGYVRIYKPDLRVRDASYYRNVYCSLCQQIGHDYGLPYRYFVSYDLTFLAIVLNAFKDSEELHSYRCPFNPFKKGKVYIDSSILKYGAFINYHMVIYKLKDNILDDHSFFARILYKIMVHDRGYLKNKKKYDTSKLDAILDELYLNENMDHSFDELTDLFGRYLQALLEGYSDTYPGELSQLVYLLGKWIYLIDAYDDLDEDIKDSSFNLLNTLENKEDLDTKVENMHYILMDWMGQLFEEIEWQNHDELLYNILFTATQLTYERIKNKRMA